MRIIRVSVKLVVLLAAIEDFDDYMGIDLTGTEGQGKVPINTALHITLCGIATEPERRHVSLGVRLMPHRALEIEHMSSSP
jgi:hypothetical protein